MDYYIVGPTKRSFLQYFLDFFKILAGMICLLLLIVTTLTFVGGIGFGMIYIIMRLFDAISY